MGKLFNKSLRRYLYIIVIAVLLIGCSKEEKSDQVKVVDLKVNHQTNPLAIDDNISFSWRMDSDIQSKCQKSYRVTVASNSQELKKNNYIWDSGVADSENSINVPYEGEKLLPGQKYCWRVSVWDNDNKESTSSEDAFFRVAIDENIWSDAKWICMENNDDKGNVSVSTFYNIQYDYMTEMSVNSGFVFGADNRQYGEYVLCSINSQQDELLFNVSEMKHETAVKETSYELADVGIDADRFMNMSHHVELKVDNNRLLIICDNKQVAQHVLDKSYNLGAIGVWTSRGNSYTRYDNIEVKDGDDRIVYADDFSKDENIFSPYYAKVSDGWVEASSGYLFTPGSEKPAPMMRKEFSAKKDIESATLYASAYGIFNIYLNGDKVSDDYFAPGHSEYTKEVYYRTYDVTSMLNEGLNAIGIIIGAGRYNKAGNNYADTLAVKCKLIINYDDGSNETISTEESWKGYANGPVRNDDMYNGEYYDCNYEVGAWNNILYDDSKWNNVGIYEDNKIKIVATDTPPVRCIETITPLSVTEPKPGVFVYDMGHNITGTCRITVKGQKGQAINIRYAEWLNEDNLVGADDVPGTIWTRNLFTARNNDTYVMKDDGKVTYEPMFVCRGYRYIEITGIDKAIPVEDVLGIVLSTDSERTGYFECSDININQIYNATYNTQLCNFMDIPTDCPQRDERFGWSGDAQVFASTAAFNTDVYQFLRQYQTSLRLGQSDSGWFPEIGGRYVLAGGSNGWSDAGVIIPWQLYLQYGDKEIIYENIDAMCRYVDYLVDTSDNYIRNRNGYSDYNSINSLSDSACNTAQCAYVSKLLSKMCEAIGQTDKAKKYNEIFSNYKDAWQQFINENGAIEDWQQSGMTLGLAFDLYSEELKADGAKCLDTSIMYSDYHVSTGYIATPFLLPTLCDNGYVDTAYRLLQQTTCPSWNYMFLHGATTLTEAWNTFNNYDNGSYEIRGSLNHFAYGSVARWMYEYILGIKPDENNPGYKHFYLQPIPGGGLSYAKGSYKSMYGTIKSEWNIEDGQMLYRCVVPANTTATLTLPGTEYINVELTSGEYEYSITILE